jgi:hypothetical protein
MMSIVPHLKPFRQSGLEPIGPTAEDGLMAVENLLTVYTESDRDIGEIWFLGVSDLVSMDEDGQGRASFLGVLFKAGRRSLALFG